MKSVSIVGRTALSCAAIPRSWRTRVRYSMPSSSHIPASQGRWLLSRTMIVVARRMRVAAASVGMSTWCGSSAVGISTVTVASVSVTSRGGRTVSTFHMVTACMATVTSDHVSRSSRNDPRARLRGESVANARQSRYAVTNVIAPRAIRCTTRVARGDSGTGQDASGLDPTVIGSGRGRVVGVEAASVGSAEVSGMTQEWRCRLSRGSRATCCLFSLCPQRGTRGPAVAGRAPRR